MNFKDTKWYRTGRVTIRNGAAIVRGVNTEWLLSGIKAGDMFTVDGSQFYEIESITSSTELNLKTQFQGENCEGQSYAIIIRTHAVMQAEIAAQLAALLDRWNSSDLASIIEFANKWQGSDILDLAGVLNDWKPSDIDNLLEVLQEWQRNGVTQLSELLNNWEDGDAERLLNLLSSWDEEKTVLDSLYKTISLTARADAWQASETGVNSYAYYIDIANDAITADMTPIVTVMPSSISAAREAEMATFAFTFDGKLRLFAQHTPNSNITLSVLLLGGVELPDTSSGDDSSGGDSSGDDSSDGDSSGDDSSGGDSSGDDNEDENNSGTGSESGEDLGLVTQEEVDDMTRHMWD